MMGAIDILNVESFRNTKIGLARMYQGSLGESLHESLVGGSEERRGHYGCLTDQCILDRQEVHSGKGANRANSPIPQGTAKIS